MNSLSSLPYNQSKQTIRKPSKSFPNSDRQTLRNCYLQSSLVQAIQRILIKFRIDGRFCKFKL